MVLYGAAMVLQELEIVAFEWACVRSIVVRVGDERSVSLQNDGARRSHEHLHVWPMLFNNDNLIIIMMHEHLHVWPM